MRDDKENEIRFAIEENYYCSATLEIHGKSLSFFSNGEKNWYQLNRNISDIWKCSVEKKFLKYAVENTKEKFIEGALSFFNVQNLI